MGKRKKNLKLKKEKARKFHLNTIAEKIAKKDQATRSKYRISADESLPKIEEEKLKEISINSYRLVFSNYNHKMCDLVSIGRKAKPFIDLLVKMTKASPGNIRSLIRDTIKKAGAEGDYKKLFSSLSNDIERLHESSFGGDGRIFFFTIERPDENYLNVVSIRPLHLE